MNVGEDGRVASLVFDRYDTNLSNLACSSKHFDRTACMRAIVAGVKHLQSLGYMHYDVRPGNIFYSARNKRFAIADFDIAHRFGDHLALKHGAADWNHKSARKEGMLAIPDLDWYTVEIFYFWIKMKGDGKPIEGETYSDNMMIETLARDTFEGEYFDILILLRDCDKHVTAMTGTYGVERGACS